MGGRRQRMDDDLVVQRIASTPMTVYFDFRIPHSSFRIPYSVFIPTIAEKLAMTVEGVKTLLRRAKASLRECVEQRVHK